MFDNKWLRSFKGVRGYEVLLFFTTWINKSGMVLKKYMSHLDSPLLKLHLIVPMLLREAKYKHAYLEFQCLFFGHAVPQPAAFLYC